MSSAIRWSVPISRLRLRLAGGFALAFALGSGVLSFAGLSFLWRESTRRFDARLDAVADGLVLALERELGETPDSSIRFVAGEVAAEWPANGDAFLLIDTAGEVVARRDPDSSTTRVVEATLGSRERRARIDRGGSDLRVRILDTTVHTTTSRRDRPVPMRVIAFGSTEGIESDTERLGVLFALGTPAILLGSLGLGYLLAGRALRPVRQLSADIAAIAPSDLSRRLGWIPGGDEVSTLATEFDSLLARLDDAQQRNQQFVREAAHQIRTPLTLVLGEASHALQRPEPPADTTELAEVQRLRATLGRVRTAAEQMRRRVDELFLLAEARAGEVVRLEQAVELDGLVLECMDLMRERASSTGHALSIERADPVVVLGNAGLLQEALLELLENACRYGATTSPITVSCFTDGRTTSALLEVGSDGPEFVESPASRQRVAAPGGGMGLSIVRWVATSHHGHFDVRHAQGRNLARIQLPVHTQ